MSQTKTCPVPKNQIPSAEFEQLKASWFFSWPIKKNNFIDKALITSWILVLPVVTTIATGSWELKNNPVQLYVVSIIISLISPLLLTIRQWMGWSYISNRLLSEKITYEESGWYDGQIWEKTIEIRAKELLIAQYEVKPILERIKSASGNLFRFSLISILILILIRL